MRSLDLRDLAPCSQFRRRNVVPILSPIARHPDQAVVGSCPQSIDIVKRWSQGIDHAALFPRLRILGGKRTNARGNSRILAGEIRADGLPGISAVRGLEQ